MSGGEASGPILLTGATGKVGRLLRGVWPTVSGAPALVPVARRPGAGVVWEPGAPTDGLPRAAVVAAFWGVVPGPGRDLSRNAELAGAAMALGRAVGARLVIHCSTSAVYAPGPETLTEEDTPAPPGPYGAAKLEMEAAVARHVAADPQGPRAVCLRIGNVAGAESLFDAMTRAHEVTLDRFADGAGPERNYIAPSDLARVVVALAAADPARLPAILNVGAPRTTAMEAIARAAGRPVLWRVAPEGAARRVALDVSRMLAICPLDDRAADPAHLVSDWRAALAAAA
ncbi:NAD-dependent epimerase/dehydratase family protein [Roseivivax isoporae]|nr:NAD-dependent epimerase/dehydratase family protein [Roseivivax isoporae]